MAAAAAAWMEPRLEMDKLSYEIFSILEAKFLFGCDAGTPPETPTKLADSGSAKVRILSIDGADGSDGLLAVAALARLESFLRRSSGDDSARIADFFDLVAGSGAGGVLAALLFCRRFSADEAHKFLTENRKRISNPSRKGIFRRSEGVFRRVFGDLTVRDAVKPLLIPCYDLGTGAEFMISRVDAVEMDGYDFRISDVCAATCARDQAVEMKSVDGRTRIVAVGGMRNPSAAAISHVLNNKQEFPRASGVEDLLVLSLGGGRVASRPSKAAIASIAAEGAADTVDQAVAMAFGNHRTTNYVRIQANGLRTGKTWEERLAVAATLGEPNVEAVLFRGSKLSEKTNAERLELFAGELFREHERRKRSTLPAVVIKQATTPRTSSATTLTSASTATSSSL